MPFIPLPEVTAAYTGSTTLPSTAVVSNVTAASAAPSAGQSTERKTSSEELPLWVETKTAEGKVS